MNFKNLAIVGMLALMGTNSWAGTTLGLGNTSCGESRISSDDLADPSRMAHRAWVSGYLSALSELKAMSISQEQSKQIHARVASICKELPHATIRQAAQRASQEQLGLGSISSCKASAMSHESSAQSTGAQ